MRTVTVSSIVTNAASTRRLGWFSQHRQSLPTTTKTIMVDNLSAATFATLGSFIDWPDLTPHRRTHGANRSGRGHLY
jgi:hypothetical protein